MEDDYCEIDLVDENDRCFCENIVIALLILFILGLVYILIKMILWLW